MTSLYGWLLPLLLTIVLTPFTPFLDLYTSHLFFQKGHFVSNDLTSFFFNYGFWPADATAIGAAVVLIGSLISDALKKWKLICLYLFLILAIGSGLIVHVLLKDTWGRPRPKQIIEFGGTQQFRPYYSPNFFHQPEPSKSFPCGHCSTGFYFFSVVLLGIHLKKRWLTLLGLFLGLGLGVALSLVRIAQGGHFFSDTLISALIMWYTSLVLIKLLLKTKP